MLVFLIFIFSITSSSDPVTLPIRWSKSAEPITQIIVGSVSRIDVVLTLGDRFSGISPSNWFPNKPLKLAFPLCPAVTIRYDRSRFPLSLGVGPTSQFITTHGSASLLTDPSRLVLGLSESQFVESCNPESVLRIPITQRQDSSFGIYASAHLGDLPDDETESGETHWDYSPSIDTQSRLRVSRSMFGDIVEILASNGATKSGMIGRLNNCHPTIIDKIPAVTVTFYEPPQNGLLPYIGTIFLDMSDYIEYRPETNTCVFQFSVAAPNGESWGFAPLSLADKNVFVSNQHLVLCDVRIPEEPMTEPTTTEATTETSTTDISTTDISRTDISTTDISTTAPADLPRRSLPVRMAYGFIGGLGAALRFIGNDLRDHYINGFR